MNKRYAFYFLLFPILAFCSESTLPDVQSQLKAMRSHADLCLEKKRDRGPFVYGEYLLWKPYVTGLPYAMTFLAVPFLGNPLIPTRDDFKLIDVRTHFHCGYRIGGGYLFPYDGIDLNLNWTKFHSKNRDSVEKGDGDINHSGLQAIWFITSATLPNRNANATLSLKLCNLDFEWGKTFLLSRPFSLRTFIGLRAASLDADLDINYFEEPPFIATTNRASEKLQNHFQGVGLRTGFRGDWMAVSWFGFYAQGSAALLKGFIRASHLEFLEQLQPAGDFLNQTFSTLTYDKGIKAALDLAVGMKWQIPFDGDRYQIRFFAGYEFNYWPSQIQQTYISVTTTIPVPQQGGDISFQGANFGAELCF